MSCFKTDVARMQAATPDPAKHVKYTQGMVLGVDDFTQEFAYLSGRDQWLARELLGYGTVRGLEVRTEEDRQNGMRVRVTAGVALSPCGQMICVRSDQCAYLNEWLAQNSDLISKRFGANASIGTVDLYVLLSYRDCPTDSVPIPGEPCRSEDELKAPSRLADDFLLELSFEPSHQKEEDALREFMQWLRSIPIVTGLGSSSDLEAFRGAVRAWHPLVASPPVSPPSSPPSSPPEIGSPPTWLQIRPEDAYLYLGEALRIWVTELRPKWFGRACGCAGSDDPKDLDDRVLLAKLSFQVEKHFDQKWWVKSGGSPGDTVVAVDESRRPWLLHLRALQEWLARGEREGPTPSDSVISETTFGSPPSAGASPSYSRSDHTHGTPALTGDVTVDPDGRARVQAIQHVPVDPPSEELVEGQVLTIGGGHWKPADLPAAPHLIGDVTGQVGSNKIAAIQGKTVAAEGSNLPNANDVLTFTGVQWQPAPVPAAVGNFVERPANLPRYLIVAAGIVKGNGTSLRPPVYNDLKATAIDSSQLFVTFSGYQKPQGEFQYIVKALILTSKISAPLVTFDRFLPLAPGDPLGLVLRVTDGNKLINKGQLAGLEFMIEVSMFWASA